MRALPALRDFSEGRRRQLTYYPHHKVKRSDDCCVRFQRSMLHL